MPYTLQQLAEYMEKQGVTIGYLAGYDTTGRFHFASTHGLQSDLVALNRNATTYINGEDLAQPERRHTRAIPPLPRKVVDI